jgi:hypothetical protein
MAIYPVHPWVDSTYTPVFHVTYPCYDATDPRQLAQYSAEHKALYAVMAAWTAVRTTPYSFTVDLSQVRSSALTRQHVIQYLERIRTRSSQYLACRAFIAPNEAVRGVATAVFWQSPPDYPHRFFDNVREARAWALEQTLELERQGLRASLAPSRRR